MASFTKRTTKRRSSPYLVSHGTWRGSLVAHSNPIDIRRLARSGVIGVDSLPPDVRILYCRLCVDTVGIQMEL